MYDVIIAGGGAVGLFMAARLKQFDMDVLILEKNTVRSKHSRSIGIHPPSLEFLEQMDIVNPFLEQGLRIPKGLAIGDNGVIGELDFQTCPGPYHFVLTLPQFYTEEILEKHLITIQGDILRKGEKVFAVSDSQNHAEVLTQDTDGNRRTYQAKFIIGCDGKQSTVRELLKIPFKGRSYPDTFVMGDFGDSTDFGPVAAIYLQSTGLIESFPLPGEKRRWVVRTPAYVENPSVDQLKKWIEPRTGYSLDQSTNTMISSFGVQHYRASCYGSGRIAIIGDAAHIVSPFGGQGMNLGWMDAWALAKLLEQHRSTGFRDLPLQQFSRRRNLAAWQAIKRAEFNMGMGRAHRHPELHEAFINSLMHLPTRYILPRLFTMRWL